LKAEGFTAAYEAFSKETKLNNVAPKYNGLLKKKWKAIVLVIVIANDGFVFC